MTPQFFAHQNDFRQWLEKNHDREKEIIVGFYKAGSGKPSLTWSESVDQALCFGWIDGVRRSIDKESYSVRFTPRKPKSIWSAVNIKKVEQLISQNLMKPTGFAAFAKRDEKRSKIYIYENAPAKFSEEFEKRFRENEKAMKFFEKQANWYKKQMIGWVMNAKQETTRQNRFEKLLAASETEKKL